jgi:hypothetical protein
MEKEKDPKAIIDSLFDEYDKMKDGHHKPSSVFSKKSGEKAMDRFLKEASEFGKQTESSQISEYDTNEQALDGKAKTKVEYYKPNVPPQKKKVTVKKEMVEDKESDEPLGFIENVYGVPRCAKEDKYLEPFTDDLLLR